VGADHDGQASGDGWWRDPGAIGAGGRLSNMAEVKVFYDREGKTLTVWFTDRSQEYVCEETGDEVVLMKDRAGHVIGFE
jgi:hypothetical protein